MDNLQDLKKELAKVISANDSDSISKLRGRISSLSDEADNKIREHQREIDFNTKEFTIDFLVNLYEDGLEEDKNELFVPDYQREFKWDEKRQSKLIESLLIGLPIPYVFTADIKNEDPEIDGRVEIVDGVQRIKTIHNFVRNNLELKDLNLLKELNGFKFEDLPGSRQRRFLRIPIRIIELSEKCDEETRRDLFERINSGSLELASQEKRHGSKRADTRFYKEVIQACAKLSKLKQLAPISTPKEKSGEYLELVLRYFAYKHNHASYEGDVAPFLDSFLDQFMSNDITDPKPFIEDFERMLTFIEAHFEFGFRKTQGSKSTPRARFESISVGVGLALDENPNIKTNKKAVSDWLFSKQFQDATTSDGANNVGNFNRRIQFVKKKLLGK